MQGPKEGGVIKREGEEEVEDCRGEHRDAEALGGGRLADMKGLGAGCSMRWKSRWRGRSEERLEAGSSSCVSASQRRRCVKVD